MRQPDDYLTATEYEQQPLPGDLVAALRVTGANWRTWSSGLTAQLLEAAAAEIERLTDALDCDDDCHHAPCCGRWDGHAAANGAVRAPWGFAGEDPVEP